MTKNVTLRLDDGLLRKARHVAVEHDQSLSQWVVGLIADAVSREDAYSQARTRALKRLAKGFRLGGTPMSREELHDR